MERDEEHERCDQEALEEREEVPARLQHPPVRAFVCVNPNARAAARVEHRVHDERLEEEHELRAHAPRLHAPSDTNMKRIKSKTNSVQEDFGRGEAFKIV